MATTSIAEKPWNSAESSFQKKIEEKTSSFPELFEKMLCGKASEIEMNSMADLYSEHGIAVLTLSEEQLSKIPNIERLQASQPNTQQWGRYGSSDKPIFSYPLAGELGTQGAVIISGSVGESCDISQFNSYLTPLHYHDGVVHITTVTQGTAIFLIAGETKQGKHIVKVPVKRGDTALIPANVIHTFFAYEGPLEAVAFTTQLIPTDSPDFLVLASEDEIKTRSFIDYPDFLKNRNF